MSARVIGFASVAAFVGLSMAALALDNSTQPTTQPADFSPCVTAALSTDPKKAEEIQELLLIVSDDNALKEDPEKFVKAIQRLGQLQAVVAVPLLVERLDLRDPIPRPRIRLPTEEEAYPALGAVVKIGQPGLPLLIEEYSYRPRSDRFRALAIEAILSIDGDNRAAARKAAGDQVVALGLRQDRLRTLARSIPDKPE